jgi:serine phosphatase RsbU (regulator of sigma subunit)
VTAIYAAAGIVVNHAAGDPTRVPDPALILFAPGLAFVFVAGVVTGYRPKPFPEWRLLAVGFAVFLVTVIDEHAIASHLVPWQLRIEPLGMLFFNGCLAAIGVARVFRNERQLIAVEKEMEAARRIQSSILPRELPQVAGIDVAVRYEPLAAVAGDFYDVVRAGEAAIAVLVADVSGHGVPAALIASMVKVAFAAEAGRTGDPAAILAGMNATLCGMFDRAYVTAVCATVDVAAGSITYATAGHPPPILVPAGSDVATLDARGMFIGMFPAATYASTTVAIDGGARLILYTDGVTEAADPATDDLFGLDRVIAAAHAERNRPARAFADDLMARITAFARRDPLPHDDVTVVVVDVAQAEG